ncbi:hypothetical protein [Fusobacterium hominis]|uniref:Uncharacterized protein n=1 Tax=Fusobacterium hominis TaxID=2764326 RepID=A0A7G9GXK0_9FUSO|nr:hypothetical protein [Fusobacterium hominis]QNM15532.1 hypothetical protein H9Q81_01440 [Fusobacterium hominis]
MKVADIISKLDLIKVMDILALNEISGNINVAYRFSNAKIGKSGYSFGRAQFDTRNNPYAIKFLKNKCDFTDSEIKRLLAMDPDVSDLSVKLYKHRHQIDAYDKLHISSLVSYIGNLEQLPDMDEESFIQILDYHNQFHLAHNGKMHRFLKSKKTIVSQDILKFKLEQLKWGKLYPADIKRRWNNIHNCFK